MRFAVDRSKRFELFFSRSFLLVPRIVPHLFFILLLIFSLPYFLDAQTSETNEEALEQGSDDENLRINAEKPTWILMLEGKGAFDEGNYGKALSYFRTVVEKNNAKAEAHLWIGYVFEAEGEFTIAERKYKESLEDNKLFSPHEEQIAAKYALARVAKKNGKAEEYKKHLQSIIGEEISEDINTSQLKAVVEIMRTSGPDKVLELYRVREKPIRQAYSDLAEQFLKERAYEKALKNFTLSFVIAMTNVLETLQNINPSFSFIAEELPVNAEDFYVKNTMRLLEDVEEEPRITDFFRSIEFYRELFFFASALHGAGYPEKAEQIWLIVKEHRESGVWSRLAREQLATPDLEQIPALLER